MLKYFHAVPWTNSINHNYTITGSTEVKKKDGNLKGKWARFGHTNDHGKF